MSILAMGSNMYNLSRLPANIRHEIETSAKLSRFFSHAPETLLMTGSDAKTVKGEKKGFLTGILYLAPYNTSGVNICPMAEKAACSGPCLFTAGRGAMNSVYYARLRKTLYWQQYQAQFLALLAKDIARIEKRANKIGYMPVIRLNGTSDIRFENSGIMQRFPNVQFYDYTKIANRRNLPANYDLTFSYSGVNGFAHYAKQALENGLRIAAVFRDRETVETMLSNGIKFLGRDIVDGDETDLRFLDPSNSIVALYAKGRAKLDGTGFVIDMPETMRQIAA